MEILNSEWLVHMLKKSSNTPQGRLLNLFNVLDDWIDAPKIENSISALQHQGTHLLQDFLALEAAKAGAEMPEMLANQLYFMAIAASQEKLSGHNINSFLHAKHAANALITAQTTKQFHISRKVIYASAASFALVSIVAGTIFFASPRSDQTQQIATSSNANAFAKANIILAANTVNSDAASPTQTAALFARIEQMRGGNCQLIEAIQLPEAYKKIYFDNIIMGQISSSRHEQRMVNELLQMVRCNYTPMLMANSK
ncbi:MAG: hypothetical protein ACO1N8_08895 [Methylophilus sp.]